MCQALLYIANPAATKTYVAPSFTEVSNPSRNSAIHKAKSEMHIIKYYAKDYKRPKEKKRHFRKIISRNVTFVPMVGSGFSEEAAALRRTGCTGTER